MPTFQLSANHFLPPEQRQYRDICAYDATGYAEVLIPFLATLLGSVALYASSICIIIETMNLTVEANVVEPRAGMIYLYIFDRLYYSNGKTDQRPMYHLAWNVLLCHVAEHSVNTGHTGMIREMCRFYSIVGSRSEGKDNGLIDRDLCKSTWS